MEFWARRTLPRNLAGAAAFIAAGLLLLKGIADASLLGALPERWQLPAAYAVVTALTLLLVRYVDRMPAAWCGLGLHRWTLRELGLGAALGAAMALVACLPIALIAGVDRGGGWSLRGVMMIILPQALNAAGEEIVFRGYLFQRAVEIIGPVAATLASALLFAIGHTYDPGQGIIPPAVIFFGGVFFALAYLKTGSLWIPIGAHAAWNLVVGNIAGLPVSGHDFGPSLVVTRIAEPGLITGGAFGPEGGLVAIVALCLGIWVVARHRAMMVAPYANATIFRAVLAAGRARRGADAA